MLENSPTIGTGDITLRNDPRVLPLGRVLRKTKINELPQLWNVLVGDMSIVGPRPLTPNHFNHYNDTDRKNIAVVTPGITGLSALVFRDEEKILSDRADPSRSIVMKLFRSRLHLKPGMPSTRRFGLIS